MLANGNLTFLDDATDFSLHYYQHVRSNVVVTEIHF